MQCRINGFQTRIGNWCRRQAGILTQVIGGFHLQILLGNDTTGIRQHIQQCGINAENAVGAMGSGILQAVINNRSNLFTVGTIRLFFDQRRDDQNILHRNTQFCSVALALCRHFLVEVAQQLIESALGIMPHIEFIGIREQIALQTGNLLRLIVDKLIVKVRLLCSFCQYFLRIDALAGQKANNFANGIAFRNGNRHCLQLIHRLIGADIHAVHQRKIIHVAVQRKGSDTDILFCTDNLAEQLEKPWIVDQASLLQFLRYRLQIIILGNLNRGFHPRLIQRTGIVHQQPADTGGQSGDHHHHDDVEDRIHVLAATVHLLGLCLSLFPHRLTLIFLVLIRNQLRSRFFVFLHRFFRRYRVTLRSRHLRRRLRNIRSSTFPHLSCVPAGSIFIVKLRHKNLLYGYSGNMLHFHRL